MLFFKKEKKVHEYYDLHCHILPRMDDGAKSSDVSLAMLREMQRQGCRGLIATSHYYDEETIEEFLKRREGSYNRLCEVLEQNGMEEWIESIGLGAEAAYYPGLASDPDLEKLCFMNPLTGERTNYLLLEMPFMRWTSQTIQDVQTLIYDREMIPIIAHLERFYDFAGDEKIRDLLNLNVIIQMNSGALLHKESRSTALQMVKTGVTQVLGTDSHNTDTRSPNMAEGIRILSKNGLTQDIEEILRNNQQIFEQVLY